jgi:hypothetical protein
LLATTDQSPFSATFRRYLKWPFMTMSRTISNLRLILINTAFPKLNLLVPVW